jgi:hypothetical protein
MDANISAVASALSSVTQNQNAQGNQNNNAVPPGTAVTLPGNITGDSGSAAVYTPGSNTFQPDMNRVNELWNSHREQVDSFRRMIESLFNQQAQRQGLADGWSLSDIEITPEMRAEAEEMIAEGGYFSVEETAARLLDFAVALSGGDPSRIDVLQRAVERGFAQAERMFGGEMPEISHQTLAAVQEGFDQWREGGVSAIELLNR